MPNREHRNNESEGVILRSVNREKIFHDESDKKRFLDTVERFCAKLKVAFICYFLSSEHVRIEVKSEDGSLISELVKRVCVSYVRHYFNQKYSRTGSLFQHRYLNFFSDEQSSVNKQIMRYPLMEKKKLEDRDSSYMETIKAFSLGECAVSGAMEITKKVSIDEYVKDMNREDRLCLTKLAYTPDENGVREYLNKAGGKRCFVTLSRQELIRVVKNLRKNRITYDKIAFCMGVKLKNLMASIA